MLSVLDQTWGYDHSIEGSTITYRIPGVHNGDYETALARVFTPATEAGSELLLATVRTNYSTVDGESARSDPQRIVVAASGSADPLSGASTYRVVSGSAMLEFAEALQQIGTLYYQTVEPALRAAEAERAASAQSAPAEAEADSTTDEEPEPQAPPTAIAGVEESLGIAREARANIMAASRRVDGIDLTDEITILDNYMVTLGRLISMDEVALSVYSNDDSLAVRAPERSTIDHLSNLFDELSAHLGDQAMSIAVAPFHIRTNVSYPQAFNDGVRAYVQQVSTARLAAGRTLVDTDRIETELSGLGSGYEDLRDTVVAIEVARSLGTDAIVTGTLVELESSFVIFARAVMSGSEEVLAAAQVTLNKEQVLDDIFGPSES